MIAERAASGVGPVAHAAGFGGAVFLLLLGRCAGLILTLALFLAGVAVLHLGTVLGRLHAADTVLPGRFFARGFFFIQLGAVIFLQDQFLHKALDDNNMYVTNLTMTDPEAAPLDFYYENPHELSYNLNQHADLDGSMAKALSEKLREYLALSARTAQDVATRTSTIECRAKKEDLMNFLADIKKMDTTVLVESVTISDYTFCPAEDADPNWTAEERAENVDHSTMTIVVKFYSVPVPTAADLGE